MNQYEVMYILDPALDDQARANLMERFQGIVTANGGMVDRVDEWGRRRLAYAINYKTEGYYILMYITAPAELPRELERNFKNVDSVLRYLVIRFEGALPPKREPFRPREAAVEKSPEAAEAPAPVAERRKRLLPPKRPPLKLRWKPKKPPRARRNRKRRVNKDE